MAAWLKRFGLHLAAALGATGIFVAAAAVGANHTRGQAAAVASAPAASERAVRSPTASPTPRVARPAAPPGVPRATQPQDRVIPERSLAGSIREVLADGDLLVLGVAGREWRITPNPGALIRLNGKAAKVDALRAGDSVVILGQAQPGPPGNRFLAHAITARRQ